MSPSTPSPKSRRERPAKPALTRAGIIAQALTILEDEGLGKVTMRRIAAALDTGPASLYVYVSNTADLHAQILDALIGQLPPARPHGAWKVRLLDLLGQYTQVLIAHHEIARMAMTMHPTGANYSALVESILGLLIEGGASDAQAAWGVDLLLASVTATAVEHGESDATADAEELNSLGKQIAGAPAEAHPTISRLAGELVSGTSEERFRWGITALINGILSTPRKPISHGSAVPE